MLNIEEVVIHQKTGLVGKIVGYGHQIVDGVYQPTLKVQVVEGAELRQKGFVEDLSSAWQQAELQEPA